MATGPPAELWRHANPETTQMYRFLQCVHSKYNLRLASYADLYKWSVDDIAAFWEETWRFVGIRASKPYHEVGLNHRPLSSPVPLGHVITFS